MAIRLPEGLTLEQLKQLDQYARERENARRREDYRRHPERAKRNRLTSAANLLYRHGLIDERMHSDIVSHIGGAGK